MLTPAANRRPWSSQPRQPVTFPALAREHTAALAPDEADDLNAPTEKTAGTDGTTPAATGLPVAGAPADPIHTAAHSRWARLIARIYEVSPLRCPECGARMRILTFLTDPAIAAAILRHLDLPTRPSAPP